MKKAKFLIPALVIIAALCFSACGGPQEWATFPPALKGTWENVKDGVTTTFVFKGSDIEYTVSASGYSFKRTGTLYYGLGPIKGPFGDDYEISYFLISSTQTYGGVTESEKITSNESDYLSFTIKKENKKELIMYYWEYEGYTDSTVFTKK